MAISLYINIFSYCIADDVCRKVSCPTLRKNFAYFAFNWGDDEIQFKQLMYRSLQFPIDFKYYFHFRKIGLALFAKAGINFSVPLQTKRDEVITPEEYPTSSRKDDPALINIKI